MLTIYKASAGSGKTFTLAYEYIKVLLGKKLGVDGDPDNPPRYVLNDGTYTDGEPLHNRHRAILAITFTKAATAEMKSRIVSELHSLTSIADEEQPKETPYASMLTAVYECSRAKLREAAVRSLRELLNDYGHFNVSTIDSFFQSVLRTFAREIDHQGDYDLALNRLDIIEQSVGLMLDNINIDDAKTTGRIGEWIEALTTERVDAGETYNVFDRNGTILRTLTRYMNDALDETFQDSAEAMEDFLSNPERVRKFSSYLVEQTRQALESISKAAKNAVEVAVSIGVYHDIKKSYADRIAIFADDPANIPSNAFSLTAVKAYLEHPEDGLDLGTVLPAKLLAKIDDSDKDRLADALGSMFATARNMSRRRAGLTQMKEAVNNLEFIVLARGALEAFLRDTNTMLIADSGDLLKRIISDSDTPFIYERLGVELETLLIDEFQDTSRMQWKNLKPLVATSLDGGHDDLIIGDVKQAIYRFRNSDPSLLGHIVGNVDFPSRHVLRGRHIKENTNHRSSHEIVRFNNTLFANMAALLGVDGYGEVVQGLSTNPKISKYPGFVRMEISTDVAKSKEDRQNQTEATYRKMAAEIQRQHDAGYRWADVMILVRKNNQAADIVSFFLRNYPEINILSNEALLLRNSQAVRTVMGLLDLADRIRRNPKGKQYYGDRETIAEFNSRCQIYAHNADEPGSNMLRALDEVMGDGGTDNVLDKVRRTNPANLVAFLECIIAEIPESVRVANQAYLLALQDKAVEHLQTANPSIRAFVDSYNRNSHKWAVQAGEGIDAVRVMTIHYSKGLEAPCVHIPLADWPLQQSDDVWLPLDRFTDIPDGERPPMLRLRVAPGGVFGDPDAMPEFAGYCKLVAAEAYSDTLNMTYVAFTRAGRELCVWSNGTNIGSDILSAVRYFNEDALVATNMLPLEDYIVEENEQVVILEVGSHTTPRPPETKEDNKLRRKTADAAAPYRIFSRDDSREFISVDDLLSDDLNAPDSPADPDDLPDGSPESLAAAKRGNAMHAILGFMKTVADLEEGVATLERMGYATADQAQDYRSTLSRAFEVAPDYVRSWFDDSCEVFAERSIYDPETKETCRPDRVVRLTDGTMIVIDYKFTTKVKQGHKRQVSKYLSLIERIAPVRAKAYLWYPLLNKVVEVH